MMLTKPTHALSLATLFVVSHTLLAAGCGVAPARTAAVAPGLPPMPEMAASRPLHAPYEPEPASAEEYAQIVENGFRRVADAPVSTFSIDVDTASYSNVRRMLRGGSLPPADAVRIEELINYFDYEYPQPAGDAPIGVTTEVAPAPWQPEHLLVHIGVQGRRVDLADMPPRNLVFLLDVSGSMHAANKLPLLKQALGLLVEQLGQRDRVSMVVYAGASGVVLPPTPGTRKHDIMEAITRLQAGGSTNGSAGIQLAYELAVASAQPGAINRVILATDGDFNVGIANRDELARFIEHKRQSGIYLTVLGLGMGNLKDATLETLADKGNGNYAYIDTLDEARKVLVTEAGGTLMTIAKDVKIQVAFDPAQVESYRLIGYENRMLAERDFEDDRKDAGEIGAGHTVTALYQVVPGAQIEAGRPLLAVKLRYKAPHSDTSVPMDVGAVAVSETVTATSEAFRFSAAVAGFGMLLRGSEHSGEATYGQIAQLGQSALGADPNGYRKELLELVETAAQLSTSVNGAAVAY